MRMQVRTGTLAMCLLSTLVPVETKNKKVVIGIRIEILAGIWIGIALLIGIEIRIGIGMVTGIWIAIWIGIRIWIGIGIGILIRI